MSKPKWNTLSEAAAVAEVASYLKRYGVAAVARALNETGTLVLTVVAEVARPHTRDRVIESVRAGRLERAAQRKAVAS